jgi:hypothetical protein
MEVAVVRLVGILFPICIQPFHFIPTMREQPSEEQDQDQDNLELDLDEHTTTYTHPLPLQHPLQPSLELVDLHDDEQLHTVPQSHSAEDELASYGALDLSAAAFDNIDPFLMQASHLHRQPTHPEPSRHFGAILDAIGAASDTLPPHQNSSDMALFETPEWSTSRQAQVRILFIIIAVAFIAEL